MTKPILTVAISILCFLITGCLIQPVQHDGRSMLPAIGNGDKIFIDRNVSDLKRGDIVVFQFPENPSQSFVKRIVGLPLETVEIRRGQIFINGKLLEEPYVGSEYNMTQASLSPKAIPEGAYFVLGDNRDNSYDSRSWGTVPRELIYGKYYSTYWKAEKK